MRIARGITLDFVLTVTLVVCAVVTVGVLVRREFASSVSAGRTEPKHEFIDNWRQHLARGVQMGPANAPVQLVEFGDFECPFCATFQQSTKTLRERYPTQVALTFVHFPLPSHRFSLPAARAAECAAEQGRFQSMHDLLFESQKDFGLKPWSEFASAAGVPDRIAFESCIASADPFQGIVDGKALGEMLNIKGTPTVIINGWRLGRPPSFEELESMVRAILAGNSPVAED
jgi:protein-disulfide isomerase